VWVSKVLRTSVNKRSRLLVTPIAFWRPDKVLVSGAKPKRFFFVERKKRQNRTNMRVLRYSLYIVYIYIYIAKAIKLDVVCSLSSHDVNDINSAKARRKKDIMRLLKRLKETFQFPFARFEGECILSLAFLSSFV